MEYVFDFQFFIKEAIFSSDSYTEDFPAVGIRLLNYPSVIIYPSNEGNTLKTMKRYVTKLTEFVSQWQCDSTYQYYRTGSYIRVSYQCTNDTTR